MTLNPTHPIDWKAKDFALSGVDGKTYSLGDVRGLKGTLVVFICNHCPYVKASISRIVTEVNALREIGIGTIAIMPNDTNSLLKNLEIGALLVFFALGFWGGRDVVSGR